MPTPLFRVLASLGAYFAKLFNASIYRSIRTNIMLTQPFMDKEEYDKLVYQALKNQLHSTLYSAKSWAMPPSWSLAQIKKVHHEHILQQGFNNPNGLILIVPHIGTWELMNAWLCQFGKLTIMYKPANNPKLDGFILKGRQSLNATLVPTDATGVKAIFKTLKMGGFTVILPDHVPDKRSGIIAPFFDTPTLTGTLTAKLAHKTNCALVGLSCVHTQHGFEIFCYELNRPELYHPDATIATTALNQAMEQMIDAHFTHYMWGYRRFKSTPFGENPYQLPFKELRALAQSYKINHTDKDNHHEQQ